MGSPSVFATAIPVISGKGVNFLAFLLIKLTPSLTEKLIHKKRPNKWTFNLSFEMLLFCVNDYSYTR